MGKGIDFLQALESATQADLDDIRAKIAEHEKQVAGLRAAAKVLDVRLNGKKERAKPQRRSVASTPGGATESTTLLNRRRQVAAYLMANGSKSREKIGAQCNISMSGPNNLGTVLSCDWFHVNTDGLVSITSTGEKANLRSVG